MPFILSDLSFTDLQPYVEPLVDKGVHIFTQGKATLVLPGDFESLAKKVDLEADRFGRSVGVHSFEPENVLDLERAARVIKSTPPYVVSLTYFKTSGKYYCDAQYTSDRVELNRIWNEVAAMRNIGQLPGLVEGAGKTFHVLIDVPNHPHNHPYLTLSTYKGDKDTE